MTWREGPNQAGFSIVGLHKIHHDDIPQVLTEKTGTGAKGMCPQYAQGSYIGLVGAYAGGRGAYPQRNDPRNTLCSATAPANVCDGSCKRLKPRLQTFATEDANVCVFQAQTLE